MAFQKTLIILIVVLSIVLVLVAGVGAWFYFNQSTGVVESTPQTPIEEPTTQQIPSEPITGPTTPSATSNTEVEGGTETETNAEEEYNNLFSAVGATRLTLLPVNSGEIYNIYAADIEASKGFFPDAEEYIFHAAEVDLNADGTNEVVVYLDLPGYCGSGGCGIDVWRQGSGGWQRIFEGIGYETIGVTESTTSGYKNLLISVHGDTGFMTQVVQMVFKDGVYQRWSEIATWNGSRFVAPQQ